MATRRGFMTGASGIGTAALLGYAAAPQAAAATADGAAGAAKISPQQAKDSLLAVNSRHAHQLRRTQSRTDQAPLAGDRRAERRQGRPVHPGDGERPGERQPRRGDVRAGEVHRPRTAGDLLGDRLVPGGPHPQPAERRPHRPARPADGGVRRPHLHRVDPAPPGLRRHAHNRPPEPSRRRASGRAHHVVRQHPGRRAPVHRRLGHGAVVRHEDLRGLLRRRLPRHPHQHGARGTGPDQGRAGPDEGLAHEGRRGRIGPTCTAW